MQCQKNKALVSLPPMLPSGWEGIYVSDFPPGSLSQLHVAILGACSTATYGTGTLQYQLRLKGAGTIICFEGEIEQRFISLWLRKFFESPPGAGGLIALDFDAMKVAAFEAEVETVNELGGGSRKNNPILQGEFDGRVWLFNSQHAPNGIHKVSAL
jgi:hypothetical protein